MFSDVLLGLAALVCVFVAVNEGRLRAWLEDLSGSEDFRSPGTVLYIRIVLWFVAVTASSLWLLTVAQRLA